MLSMQELEATLPSMTQWRSQSPRAVDWRQIERELGTRLPTDYQALGEAYPTLVIDDFLVIGLPKPGAESTFVDGSRSRSAMLRDLWEVDESEGYKPYPEPGGLLSWGESLSGDHFYWKVESQDPDLWPIVVGGRNGEWSEFPGGMVRFLVDTYRRTIQIPGMPAAFPGSHPEIKGIV